MNREIKFRAWIELSNGVGFYVYNPDISLRQKQVSIWFDDLKNILPDGYYIYKETTYRYAITKGGSDEGLLSVTVVEDIAYFEYKDLEQYIGPKDKNRVGIYEGDIVETPNKPNLNLIVGWCEIHLCYLLEHENLHETETPRLTSFDKHTLKVIGNKYENPELLED